MRIEVYLPSVQQCGNPVTSDVLASVRSQTVKILCGMFGGCSSYLVSGDWLDNEGRLHSEETRVVYSYGELTPERQQAIEILASWIAIECNQAAVMVALGDSASFISQSRETS
jgi:hypothetical protein